MARDGANRIAREGRKYGVGLMLVTQRPSELPDTALVQCGTIVALRLSNSSDQAKVRAALPDGAAGLAVFAAEHLSMVFAGGHSSLSAVPSNPHARGGAATSQSSRRRPQNDAQRGWRVPPRPRLLGELCPSDFTAEIHI